MVSVRKVIVAGHEKIRFLYGNWEHIQILLNPVTEILLLGILFVALSLTSGFEVPASGSVLVLCALASDLLLPYTNLHRCYPDFVMGSHTDIDISNTLKKEDCEHCGYHFVPLERSDVFWAQVYINPGPDIRKNLYHLASKKLPSIEITHNKEGKPFWQIDKTHERVSRNVRLFVIVYGIFGTALWGYGHLIFS